MKRILALLLVLVLVLSAFAGCASKPAEEPAAEEALKVGFIYVGPANDGGFSQTHDMGRQAMVDHFAGKVETLVAESVPEDKQAVKNAAINMIDQGATVIVATSFAFMDAVEEMSTEYPDVKFIHFSGNKMNDTNFGNYFGAMEEPRYLAGIIAGMKTESNKIGFVAAFPYTELLIGINAFTLGAQSVNPDATVNVVYTNSWYDPANEKAAAESLLAQGCDIIAQHCDTAGPQIAAQEAGAFAIGYNMDSSDKAPGAYLTAPVWHHEAYLIPLIQAIMDGTWTPESYYGTMADGYVGLADYTENVPAEAIAKADEVKAKIESGEFKIFTGPIKDNTGKVRVEAGQSLDRAGIWSIDYLVEGATGVSN